MLRGAEASKESFFGEKSEGYQSREAKEVRMAGGNDGVCFVSQVGRRNWAVHKSQQQQHTTF